MMFANDPGAIVAQFLFGAVDAFALTILVFLRRGFGERFYTVLKFGMGLGILSFLMALRSFAGALLGVLPMVMTVFGVPPLIGMLAGPLLAQPHHHEPRALFDAAGLLYWGFVIVGGGQLAAVWLRSWRLGEGVHVHSKSTGESLLSFGGRVNHWIATIILEPFVVLLLGQLLHACDPTVPTTYFAVLAFFIGASALHQYRLYRDAYLDELDSRLLAGFYSEQAKRVEAGRKPAFKLGSFFFPLILPRKPAMQVDMLREWARRHQEGGADSAEVRAASMADEPPPSAPPAAAA
jgi:hypothetical protein